MSVIQFPTTAQAGRVRRGRRAWLVATLWLCVLVLGIAGPLLPVGLRLLALTLSLSACGGVSLLLSHLAVRETCASFEGKLARLRKSQEDLLERMIAYGEAADRSAYEGMVLVRNTARLVAAKMGLDEADASAIGRAAGMSPAYSKR